MNYGGNQPPMGRGEAAALYALIVGTFLFAALIYAFASGALKL